MRRGRRRGARIAEPLGLEFIIAEALNNKSSALGYLGRQRESLALMRGR
jgi:hypothetical protein